MLSPEDGTAESATTGLDLTGQTWLVTGTSSGLGAETTRVLALRGADVVPLDRTHGVDLADLAQVQDAVTRLKQGPKLAGVIANAGIMTLPELHLVDGVERQLAVNHLGHFALLTGLLDHLDPDARIVVVTSEALRLVSGDEITVPVTPASYDPWLAYGASKLANWLFVRGLADRGFTANAAHPGPVRTGLTRHRDDPDDLYDAIADQVKTVGQGAATQVRLAVDPTLAGVTGRYFSDCAEEDPQADATDADVEALWAWSEPRLRR